MSSTTTVDVSLAEDSSAGAASQPTPVRIDHPRHRADVGGGAVSGSGEEEGEAERKEERPPSSMEDVERLLRSLQSKSKEALSQNRLTRHLVMQQMSSYLNRLELDVSRLSVVHVAGTKGKGSTCAFVESILRERGHRTGLYTSPHLVHLRERIRIDGEPIEEAKLFKYFHACWTKLRATVAQSGDDCPPMPGFFRFLTLLALYVYVQEGVDVVVLEVGIGGRLDATNIIAEPVVCGITLLDLDHCAVLGDTIDKIAYEKAGIIKPGVPVFGVPQDESDATRVLAECAVQEGEVTFTIVEPLNTHVPSAGPETTTETRLRLGIDGKHQFSNAALAVCLARQWIMSRGVEVAPELFDVKVDNTGQTPTHSYTIKKLTRAERIGLERCSWPGRCQSLRVSPNLELFIDGAHTHSSIAASLEWFESVTSSSLGGVDVSKLSPIQRLELEQEEAEQAQVADEEKSEQPDNSNSSASSSSSVRRVLLFNCGHDRNSTDLLETVFAGVDHSRHFSTIITCPFDHDRFRMTDPPTIEQLLQKNKSLPRVDPPKLDARSDDQSSKSTTSWQHTLLHLWRTLVTMHCREKQQAEEPVDYVYQASVANAVQLLRRMAADHPELSYQVLVTGSLYLAGNVLGALQ